MLNGPDTKEAMMRSKNWNYSEFICSFILCILAVLITPASAQQEIRLVFGLYTTDKPTALVKSFRPILTAIEADLSQSLGVPVTIRTHISSTYEQGVAALVNGDVDFARLGPASYIAAKEQNPHLSILGLISKDSTQTTKGVISVHKDGEYNKIEDLIGARFAFGNEESTIGRYLSQAYLLKHGITARELEHFEYLQRHDRVAYAVAGGSFDAGALKEGTFNNLQKKGLPIKALARFDNVNIPWIASSQMDDALVKALRSVMFELSAPEAFKALGHKQFVVGRDIDFQEVRDAIKNNDQFFIESHSINTADTDTQ